MKFLILILILILNFSPYQAHTNEILMRDVNARTVESEHNIAIAFWSNEEAHGRHKFFEEAGGDRLGLKELNLRAIEIWIQLSTCINSSDGKLLAEAFLYLERTCPNLQIPVQELNRNYVEFLSSVEFSPHVVKLDNSRKYGRVPLHPLLQQFSFNYYIQVISAFQFDARALIRGDLQSSLSVDIEKLAQQRKQKKAAVSEAEAAWKDYMNDRSFWGSFKKGRKAMELAQGPNGFLGKIDVQAEEIRKQNRDWNTTYKYSLAFDRFLINNFILSVQNMIHLFPSSGCKGIGIYEYANLSGILVHRLQSRSYVSYPAETEFRNMILNFCNHKTHYEMTNWVKAWGQEGSDPLPEAFEISKLNRKFPLDFSSHEEEKANSK